MIRFSTFLRIKIYTLTTEKQQVNNKFSFFCSQDEFRYNTSGLLMDYDNITIESQPIPAVDLHTLSLLFIGEKLIKHCLKLKCYTYYVVKSEICIAKH